MLLPRSDRQRLVGDEGVGAALLAKGRELFVTGHESYVIAQRPKLLGDRGDQVREAAARKVGAADRAGEEDVANLGEPGLAVEEDHVAGGVAGAVVDLPLGLAERDAVAVLQPAVRRE